MQARPSTTKVASRRRRADTIGQHHQAVAEMRFQWPNCDDGKKRDKRWTKMNFNFVIVGAGLAFRSRSDIMELSVI